jgi:hypothetical protein
VKCVLVTVAAVAAVLVAAAHADTPPFPECAVTSTSTTGGVTKLVSTKAWVTSKYIGGVTTLKKADSICTNPTGALWWNLKTGGKTVMCNTAKSSSLRIFPPTYPGQAVRFRRGTSTCQVTGHGTMLFAVDGTTLVIRFDDPLLVVTTDPAQGTTVKLVQGFAQVTGQGGGRSVVVAGPGQQTVVPVGGDPESPSRSQLEPAESAAVKVLRRSGPQPSLARPPAGKSPVLRGIFSRGTIRVAVDVDSVSESTEGFVEAYFEALAASWRVSADVTTATGADALKGLADRSVDVVVTPNDVSGRFDLDALPFVLGPDDSDVSQLVIPQDATFGEAMSTALQQRLFFGTYGDLYRSAFDGAEAQYDPLRSVLPA